MRIRRNTKENSGKWEIWIKVIPIVLTAIGLAFTAYQWSVTQRKNQSKINTWEDKKKTYQELLTIIGKIGATKGNDSLLHLYSSEFEAFYLARMRQAEGNDTLLIFQMMMMKKDIQNSLQHKVDFYHADKLEKTCQKLSLQIRDAIAKGDEEL